MLANHLTTGISDDGKSLVLKAHHPHLSDGTTSVALADLERRGIDGAVVMLGTFMLEGLRLVHAEALAPYPGLLPPPEDSPSQEKIALAEQLTILAMTEPDPAYLPLLDRLMAIDPARRRSAHPFVAGWPEQRALLARLHG